MRSRYLPENASTLFLWARPTIPCTRRQQAAAYYHRFLEAAGGKFPIRNGRPASACKSSKNSPSTLRQILDIPPRTLHVPVPVPALFVCIKISAFYPLQLVAKCDYYNHNFGGRTASVEVPYADCGSNRRLPRTNLER